MGTVGAMVGRIAVTAISPSVACGQYSARAVTGETVVFRATAFREGQAAGASGGAVGREVHGAVAADVVVRAPGGERQPFLRMVPGAPGTDRWHAAFRLPE